MKHTSGHFEFYNLDRDGLQVGEPLRLFTATGIIFNCHPEIDADQVRHLAQVSREAIDHPVDICLWRETEYGPDLVWSARIYWRDPQKSVHKAFNGGIENVQG